ncbi:hypothetical protein KKC52_12950, partial [bacterium]|nr:hypothetical protein [bacterium]
IDFGSHQTITTTTSTENGTFSVSFRVDTQPYSSKTITVTGVNSGYKNTTTFFLKPNIAVVDPQSGKVGGMISVIGTGFGSGTYLYAYFDGRKGTESYPSGYIPTGSNGTFSITFIVDQKPCGTKIISVSHYNNSLIFATNIFVIMGRITNLVSSSNTVGTIITVKGDGFETQSIIRIDFGTQDTITTTITDNINGTFSATFLVNTQVYGSQVITVRQSNLEYLTLNTTVFFITPKIIQVMPTFAQVGKPVTVIGNGFSAGLVTIQFGTHYTITTGTVDATGTFSVTFLVSTQLGGKVTPITASQGSVSVDTNIFTIKGDIILISPPSGPVDTSFTLHGTGYGYSTAPIFLRFEGDSADTPGDVVFSNGTFSAFFSASVQPYGTRVVTAVSSPGDGCGLEIDTTTFFITAKITNLNPSEGAYKSVVEIRGDGYEANGTVTIDFGTAQTITSTQSNPKGEFSTTFTVNLQGEGIKVITVKTSDGALDTTTFSIKPTISLISPTSGNVSNVVTVEGAGYQGTESIYIDFGTSRTIATTATSADGTFSVTFVVDTQIIGLKVVTITGTSNISHVNTTTFTIIPRISLVLPPSGPVGSYVDVWGDGYNYDDPNPPWNIMKIGFGTAVEIYLSTYPSYMSSNGTFSGYFIVNTQPMGTTVLTTRRDQPGGGVENATSIFIITPKIRVSPEENMVHHEIVVMGTGYKGSETIQIDFGSRQTIATTIANINGEFSVAFAVDTQPLGTRIITADGLGTESYLIATVIFQIRPELYFLSPGNGSVGDKVTLKGTGYTVNGSVTIHFGTHQTITTTQAGPNGTFSISFMVSTQTNGGVCITGQDDTSSLTDTTIFSINAKITLISPPSGVVGTLVTVHGSGYPVGDIYIFFGTDSSYKAVGINYVNSNGTFSITFTVNTQGYGTTTVTAQKEPSFSNPLTWAVSAFVIKANITVVYPSTDTVGNIVTVQGTGYSGVQEIVSIHFGTHNTIATTTSTTNGTFSVTFRVDTQPGETKVITAIGTILERKATSTFWIQSRIISVSPSTQIVQGRITVEGTGYRVNEWVRIDFGSHLTITTVQAKANGTFSISFLVSTQPYDNPINKIITATGLGSQQVATNTDISFSIKPNIFCIDPGQGSPGKIVAVWGTGYHVSEAVSIYFGTDSDAQHNVSTDINGTFSTTFKVTAQPNGSTVITATDASGVNATSIFIIIAGISGIQPEKGPVGTVVTIDGGGYAGGSAVQIDFGTHITITTIVTMGSGTFAGTFVVSTQVQGTTVVTVMNIDGSGLKATTLFEILSQIILITPKIGFVDEVITVEGTGYGTIDHLDETIQIDFGTHYTIATTISSTNGTFSVTFLISSQPYGIKAITVTGDYSDQHEGESGADYNLYHTA